MGPTLSSVQFSQLLYHLLSYWILSHSWHKSLGCELRCEDEKPTVYILILIFIKSAAFKVYHEIFLITFLLLICFYKRSVTVTKGAFLFNYLFWYFRLTLKWNRIQTGLMCLINMTWNKLLRLPIFNISIRIKELWYSSEEQSLLEASSRHSIQESQYLLEPEYSLRISQYLVSSLYLEPHFSNQHLDTLFFLNPLK